MLLSLYLVKQVNTWKHLFSGNGNIQPWTVVLDCRSRVGLPVWHIPASTDYITEDTEVSKVTILALSEAPAVDTVMAGYCFFFSGILHLVVVTNESNTGCNASWKLLCGILCSATTVGWVHIWPPYHAPSHAIYQLRHFDVIKYFVLLSLYTMSTVVKFASHP